MSLMQELGVHLDAIHISRETSSGDITSSYTVQIDALYANPSKISYIIAYIQKHYAQELLITKSIS